MYDNWLNLKVDSSIIINFIGFESLGLSELIYGLDKGIRKAICILFTDDFLETFSICIEWVLGDGFEWCVTITK